MPVTEIRPRLMTSDEVAELRLRIGRMLAMVETGMVEAQEVFLPYWEQGGKTLYQHLQENRFKALPAPSGETQ